jgi:hypothetical protein
VSPSEEHKILNEVDNQSNNLSVINSISSQERNKLAFEYVADVSKQLITLVSLIIGVSITLINVFVVEIGGLWRWGLAISWVLFICSIVCGLFTFGALIYQLAPQAQHEINVFAETIRYLQLGQYLFFFLGLVVMVTVLFTAPQKISNASIDERVTQTLEAKSVIATVNYIETSMAPPTPTIPATSTTPPTQQTNITSTPNTP